MIIVGSGLRYEAGGFSEDERATSDAGTHVVARTRRQERKRWKRWTRDTGADVLLLGLEVHCRCTCGPGGGHEEGLLCGATDIVRAASLYLGS